ncbi:MAG: RAMP superfamily CRISPR-associated protein, partial [Candidatus Rokuibacteriota bacterium]
MVALLDRPGVVGGVSPGFYFQRCLGIWEQALDKTKKEKAPALTPVAGQGSRQAVPEGPVVGDLNLYRALLQRHERTFQQLRASFDGVELPLRNLAPFVTGIGQPHPLETGFAFLKPYGVPYLAGSGVKGAVRAACTAAWEDAVGEQEARASLKHYFGSESKDERDEAAHRRGALVFLDLFPELGGLEEQGWSGA